MIARITQILKQSLTHTGVVTGFALALTGCGGAGVDGADGNDVAATSQAVLGPTLPAGWSTVQIGTTSVASTVQYDPTRNQFQIDGAGSLPNSYQFTYKSIAGDFQITAGLSDLTGHVNARFGVAVKSQLNSASSTVALVGIPGDPSPRHDLEKVGNGPLQDFLVPASNAVKITRHGNVISTYVTTGSDAFAWQLLRQVTLPDLGAAAYYGLIVASGATNETAHAAMAGIDVVKLNPYTSVDIGSVGAVGSTAYDANANTWTVRGGGTGMVGSADSLRFAYRKMIGNNVDFAVKIDPANGPSGNARGGVMLRTSLSANSPGVFLAIDNSDRFFYTTRTTTGGTAVSTQYTATPYGSWMRVFRLADTVVAANSSDGSNWTVITSFTIPFDTPAVYVGLADTGGVSGQLGTLQDYESVFWSPTMQ